MAQNIYCTYKELSIGMPEEAKFISAENPQGALKKLNGHFSGLNGAWLITHEDGMDIVGAGSEERATLTFLRYGHSENYEIQRIR